jgi:hypothetical protein
MAPKCRELEDTIQTAGKSSGKWPGRDAFGGPQKLPQDVGCGSVAGTYSESGKLRQFDSLASD